MTRSDRKRPLLRQSQAATGPTFWFALMDLGGIRFVVHGHTTRVAIHTLSNVPVVLSSCISTPAPTQSHLTPADQDAAGPLLQLVNLDGRVGGDGAVTGHSVPEQPQQGVVQLGRDARHVHQHRDLWQAAHTHTQIRLEKTPERHTTNTDALLLM